MNIKIQNNKKKHLYHIILLILTLNAYKKYFKYRKIIIFDNIHSYKEPGAYTYKDNCGDTVNLVVDSNLGKIIL